MKNLYFAFCVFFSILTIQSTGQSYFLNNGFTNGGTVTTCNGKFYDSHQTDNYSPNEHYSVTFSSGTPNKIIQVVLSTITLSSGDTLFSFDGNSTSARVIDTFTNSTQNLVSFTPSLANTSGSITFKFVSDGTNESAGWEGEIKCIYPCKQKISGNTFSTPAKDANGYTNVCFGDTASLSVVTQYPNNNLIYRQADSSSVFHWIFGDGVDTSGKNLLAVKHLYTTAGGYYARLIITDSNGCSNYQPIRTPVRTSLRPIFNITPPPYICLFDTAVLKPVAQTNGLATITTPTASFVTLPISGDSVALPDNPPACFTSSIVIEQFAPNQTLQNLNDLEGIFMNMEHSYLGDLTISIEAPNGVKVFLKTTVEGSPNDGTFLGEPVDESLWGVPTDTSLVNKRGKGYDYCFCSKPTYGTMWDEVSKYTYSYTDNAGQVVTDHYYLPAGSYKSEESLLPLIGTPLNGRWTLEVCDQQAIDNGYVFNWTMRFNKSILPTTETYTVPPVSQTWITADNIIVSNYPTANISPQLTGTLAYTFRVTDAFSCVFDTTVQLVVNPIPAKPNLGADTSLCTGKSVTLKVLNVEPSNTYYWSTNQKGVPSITTSQAGAYTVETANSKGCKNRDTINVFHINPFIVNLGKDRMYCASKPNLLSPYASTTIESWNWSTGKKARTDTISGPGTYWVEAKSTDGCLVRDTITVTDNPINVFTLPRDTTICENANYTMALFPPDNTKISWNDNTQGYQKVINKAGTYVATSDYKGCIATSKITITTKPIPIFTLGKDTAMCNGYKLSMKASYPGATYRWNTGTTDSVFVADRTGLYWAEAKLNGCSYRDSLLMQQKMCACEIKMPNAFSPNGDGINDYYVPTIKCFPRDYHLSIFNRLGQLIFNSKDPGNLWNGKYNGTDLPVATYYYILNVFNEDLMQNEKITGSITLLR